MGKLFFRCKVCGDIHYGLGGPAICPTCQNKNAYVLIEKDVAEKVLGF